jgi:diguanylate cyclase
VARFRLSATMPAALDRDEFTLVYQPLVDLRDGQPRGVEALARWRHPHLGMLHPDRFIDLAEDTGLMVRLGLRLLEKACRQAATWHGRCPRPPFVSIDLAVAQIRHPGLVADITEILDRTALPADHLQLESSENALADNHHTMIATLNALANLGVRLAIDEFGTGYANLTHLRELPVHSLKLAGSLVRCLQTQHTSDPIGETLLTTLISLGHALGLTITAEGVQTPVQAQRLAASGCELGQGHYLGRPATPRRISQLFTRR